MRDLFIYKPGKIGRIAAEWHLFKQQMLYPTWFFFPDGRLRVYHRPLLTIEHNPYIKTVCHVCEDKWGMLIYDSKNHIWILDGLDPGHIIGKDRSPKDRFNIMNIQPECRACNSAKER